MRIVNTSEPAVVHGRPRRRHVLHADGCERIRGEVIFEVHESEHLIAVHNNGALGATWCGPCLATAMFSVEDDSSPFLTAEN